MNKFKALKIFEESETIKDIFELNKSMAWARTMYDETKDPAFLRVIKSCEDQLNGDE